MRGQGRQTKLWAQSGELHDSGTWHVIPPQNTTITTYSQTNVTQCASTHPSPSFGMVLKGSTFEVDFIEAPQAPKHKHTSRIKYNIGSQFLFVIQFFEMHTISWPAFQETQARRVWSAAEWSGRQPHHQRCSSLRMSGLGSLGGRIPNVKGHRRDDMPGLLQEEWLLPVRQLLTIGKRSADDAEDG